MFRNGHCSGEMICMSNNNYVVYDVLLDFFRCYLTERNIQKTLDFVTEDVFSVGTGQQEVALNKKELQKLLENEIGRNSTPIDFEIKNYKEKKYDDSYFCFCNVNTKCKVKNSTPVYFNTRVTATFKMVDGSFKASSIHMSEACLSQQDEEYFPLRYGTEVYKKISSNSICELLNIMNEFIPVGIMGGYVEPDFPLYFINDSLLNLLGYTYEELISETNEKISSIIHPDDLKNVYNIIRESFDSGNHYNTEYRLKKKDGEYLWVYDIGRKIITDDNRVAIISIIMDISENVRVTNQLRDFAMKDPLTDIYNRRAAITMVDQYLSCSGDYCFMILDIDNFKIVNDCYGHNAGDKCLIALANLFKTNLRNADICARIGGDEFIIFLPNTRNTEGVRRKLENINKMFVEEVKSICNNNDLDKVRFSLGGVTGVSKTSFAELYMRADRVLYEVKRNHKGDIKIIDVM